MRNWILAISLLGVAVATEASTRRLSRWHSLELTKDVIFGPAQPVTADSWRRWRDELDAYRHERRRAVGMPSGRYAVNPHSDWSDQAFRQFHLYMYDLEFLRDGQYHTAEWLDAVERRFGKIDSVVLWQAYPQLGIDSRNQFDFYRQMPGGLAGLKREVSDVLHARQVRVIAAFNPWDDRPNYTELADVVASIDADAVMLDTLYGAPDELRRALERRKPGIVLAPERRADDRELPTARASWAQWYDLGPDGSEPDKPERAAIWRQKWIVPQHMQHSIRRWDTDRARDIVFSFFNGSGMLIWDNIFGSWNPYSARDRRLLAETSTVQHAYADLLAQGEWLPLLPTGQAGLDMNAWRLGQREIRIYRNRTDRAITLTLPQTTGGLEWSALWDGLAVPAHGTQALVLDTPEHAANAREHMTQAGRDAEGESDPSYDTRTPTPKRIHGAECSRSLGVGKGFSAIPSGNFEMVIEHARRESGCYPLGIGPEAMWGWYYEDALTHRIPSEVAAFALKSTAVTNAEYLEYVRLSGYEPGDSARFLAQIPRLVDGSLPATVGEPLASLPVTYVGIEDARAYAAWVGARLPTEAEWQWAAEGAGADHSWPWGDASPKEAGAGAYNRTGRLAAAATGATTPQGVRGLTGNAWEWTDSEWTDGHSRFAMLRGGTYLPQPMDLSEWMLPRGPHRNGYHAKFFLVSGGLDRSETISFRVARDVAP